jgi:ABC-type nitrate/sulfonate/bicarbonate transport system permease component
LWQFVFSTSPDRIFLFSSPSLVLHSLIDNVKSGLLIRDIYITGQEALYGFLLGNIVGALIGL